MAITIEGCFRIIIIYQLSKHKTGSSFNTHSNNVQYLVISGLLAMFIIQYHQISCETTSMVQASSPFPFVEVAKGVAGELKVLLESEANPGNMVVDELVFRPL